jgi:transposase InsO family protein
MILDATPKAKFAIIREVTRRDDNLLNIKWLCEIAGVSRWGYYKWLAAESKRGEIEERDRADFALILRAYQFRGYDKGAAGIHMRLLHLKPPVIMNIKKIRRLMKKYNLYCPIRKPNPHRQHAKALQASKVAPNLLNRQFRSYGPRMVLLTDITYISREGDKYSYLSVIMDAYTKEVLAHVLSASLEVDFVLLTVQMLLDKHGAELKTDALVHSDQGTHYTCSKFVEIIANSNLRQSMSRKGNCWDNAPQESFFGHMKDSVKINASDQHHDIARKIDDWIDYYNNDRYQWQLAKLSPTAFYQYIQTGDYPLSIDPPPIAATDNIESEGGIDLDTDEERH